MMNKDCDPEQTGQTEDQCTNFYSMFVTAERPMISYMGKMIHWWDSFPVSRGEKIRVIFESTSSEWKQGIKLIMWGRFELLEPMNRREKNSLGLWEGVHPKDVVVQLFPGKKPKNKDENDLPEDHHLMVQNMWYNGKVVGLQKQGAAMRIEEVNETTKRYYCNDGHLDNDFDDLVFTIERLGFEGNPKK